MAFNYIYLVLVAFVILIIAVWGALCYKRKTFFVCCANIADFQPKVKMEDGTEQPQFSALSMAFYEGVGGTMLGDQVNPEKVIGKEKAEGEREASTSTAEHGNSNFSKDANDGDMIKRY